MLPPVVSLPPYASPRLPSVTTLTIVPSSEGEDPLHASTSVQGRPPLQPLMTRDRGHQSRVLELLPVVSPPPTSFSPPMYRALLSLQRYRQNRFPVGDPLQPPAADDHVPHACKGNSDQDSVRLFPLCPQSGQPRNLPPSLGARPPVIVSVPRGLQLQLLRRVRDSMTLGLLT